MTREDVIRIAQEAGIHLATDVNWMPIIGLEYAEKFAAIAYAAGAAAEREEIMLLCYEIENDFKEELGVTGDSKFYERMLGVVECLDEIRAREQS